MPGSNNIKSLALYLPQYHPTDDNDRWWGKGFTEWTNVTKAKPLFKNHWQPRLPADLGFYDLRVPEVRQAQADLALKYGLYGFCYWHYWFAGKTTLERPFNEVLKSGKPDFPFCLAWANQTWKGTWHGLSNDKILIEQTYPGKEDDEAHFYSLLDAFHDPRYITVNGKPLFFIFRPTELPESKKFTDCWNKLAQKEGLKGFHMVAMHMFADWNYIEHGYDAITQHSSSFFRARYNKISTLPINHDLKRYIKSLKLKILKEPAKTPRKFLYTDYANAYSNFTFGKHEYPVICADWDNTPRSGVDGRLFSDFNMELFEKVCFNAFKATENKPIEEKFVIVKSWNEWAEGNYVEPDQKYGHGYLEALKNALQTFQNLK